MIRKLQKEEETETGIEAISVKRIMAKLQSPTAALEANYLQNRVLLNKWALGMIRKLQKEEETETGKEAKSVKRIMAKLQSPTTALEALATLINK